MTASSSIFLEYICPSMGVIMATTMFAAPVTDLRNALLEGRLGALNPVPWPFMTGNCLGWVVYAYYTRDPFVLAANMPGLILSIWLNMGAAKLQYAERYESSKRHRARTTTTTTNSEHWDASPPLDGGDEEDVSDSNAAAVGLHDEEGFLIMVPQERLLMKVMIAWALVIVLVGWFSPKLPPATTVGLIVNLNLIVFYAAPLESMQTVIRTKHSDSIHPPTMVMNWINTSFWILYGAFVRHDIMILLPNSMGLTLGLMQGVLCLLYPRSRRLEQLSEPLASEADGLIVSREANESEEESETGEEAGVGQESFAIG